MPMETAPGPQPEEYRPPAEVIDLDTDIRYPDTARAEARAHAENAAFDAEAPEIRRQEAKLEAVRTAEAANLARRATDQDPLMSSIRAEVTGDLNQHIAGLKSAREAAMNQAGDEAELEHGSHVDQPGPSEPSEDRLAA